MVINDFRNFRYSYIDQDQLKNAKLYGTREDFVATLPKNLIALEVGVLAGDYIDMLEKFLNPKELHLLDTFNSNDFKESNRFTKEKHYEYVLKKYKNKNHIKILKGLSQNIMKTLNSNYYDYIYMDASNSYDEILEDLQNAIKLLKNDGIIGINDYVVADKNNNKYDQVSVYNGFLHANKNWEVISLTLHPDMYCDLHIRKKKNE